MRQILQDVLSTYRFARITLEYYNIKNTNHLPEDQGDPVFAMVVNLPRIGVLSILRAGCTHALLERKISKPVTSQEV